MLGAYFLCWPRYQEFKEKKAEIETRDEDIKNKEEYLSKLEALSERLSEYDEELSKIDSALPFDASAAALFNFFQKTSSENGLILTGIDVSELFSSERSEQRIQEMFFSLSVSGSYSAFKNFLSAVYRNSRLIEVKSINFPSSEEGIDLFNFNLSLETHAY